MSSIFFHSVIDDCDDAADQYKWIKSQERACDLGEPCRQEWYDRFASPHVRACYAEHLFGRRAFLEFDRSTYGACCDLYANDAKIVDWVIDRVREGRENLCLLTFAAPVDVPPEKVVTILERININDNVRDVLNYLEHYRRRPRERHQQRPVNVRHFRTLLPNDGLRITPPTN